MKENQQQDLLIAGSVLRQPVEVGRISFLGQEITAEAQRTQRKDSMERMLVLLRVLCVSAVRAFRSHREMHPHKYTPSAKKRAPQYNKGVQNLSDGRGLLRCALRSAWQYAPTKPVCRQFRRRDRQRH